MSAAGSAVCVSVLCHTPAQCDYLGYCYQRTHGARPVPQSSDAIVDTVRTKIAARSLAGIQKYGADMTRKDLTTRQWLTHAQEEAMDLAVYLQRLIEDLPE